MPYGGDEYFDDDEYLSMEDENIGYSSPSDDEGVDEQAEEMFRNPSGRTQEEPYGSFYFGSHASSPSKRDESDSVMRAGHEAQTDIKDGLAGLTEDEVAALTEEELIWLVFDKERQKQQVGAQELRPSGGQPANDYESLTPSTSNIVTRTQVATISSQLPDGTNTSPDMPSQNTAYAMANSAEGEGVSLSAADPVPLPVSISVLTPDNGRAKKPSGAGHGRYKRRDNHSRRESRYRRGAISHRVKSGRVDKGRGRVNNGGGRPKRNRRGGPSTPARFSNVSLASRVSFFPLERRVTYGEPSSTVIKRGPPSYRQPCRHEDRGRQCKKAECKFLHRNQVGPFRSLLFSLAWSSK